MAKETKSKKENNRHFFKDFKAELKKVIWPTPKQVLNNTTAVITIVLITAAIVFVLDVAFEKLNTQGIDKLKSVISSSQTNSIDANSINNNTIEGNAISLENTISQDNTVSE